MNGLYGRSVPTYHDHAVSVTVSMRSDTKDIAAMSTPHLPKTALLVVDLQRFFGRMMDAPLPYIKTLHSFFTSHGWPIIFTQHGHTQEDITPPITNQLIRKVGIEDALMTDTRDWELIPDIWKLMGDAPVVRKNTYDAFERTDLHSILQAQGVRRVLVCGVMTEVCCETTVRSAFVKDYEAWLVSDACGTDNPVAHERALESAARLLVDGDVLTTEQAIARLISEAERAILPP